MENIYIEAIKKLANAHYEHRISMDEYRTKRRKLIDQMDNEFNGSKTISLDTNIDINRADSII